MKKIIVNIAELGGYIILAAAQIIYNDPRDIEVDFNQLPELLRIIWQQYAFLLLAFLYLGLFALGKKINKYHHQKKQAEQTILDSFNKEEQN